MKPVEAHAVEEPMNDVRRASVHVPPMGGRPSTSPWGDTITVKVQSAQTSGAFTMTELIAPPGWSRPPYIHHDVDECFFVVHGTFAAVLDGACTTVPLAAGAVLYVARGVARSLTNTGGEGRLLVLQTPGHPVDDMTGAETGIEHLPSFARTW